MPQPAVPPPVDPPPTRWILPDASTASVGRELLGIGADLEPGTLLAAYRSGLFPMPTGRRRAPVGWWSPDPRGVLLAGDIHVARSMRAPLRRYALTVDTCFDDVVRRCGDPRRAGAWITPAIRSAYSRLHELGWAHSVEVRDDDGTLVGGLYGVRIGGLFAGESMFHVARDASKVAVVATAQALGLENPATPAIFDVQWATPHLRSLGAREIPRATYLDLLAEVIDLPVEPFSLVPPAR